MPTICRRCGDASCPPMQFYRLYSGMDSALFRRMRSARPSANKLHGVYQQGWTILVVLDALLLTFFWVFLPRTHYNHEDHKRHDWLRNFHRNALPFFIFLYPPVSLFFFFLARKMSPLPIWFAPLRNSLFIYLFILFIYQTFNAVFPKFWEYDSLLGLSIYLFIYAKIVH